MRHIIQTIKQRTHKYDKICFFQKKNKVKMTKYISGLGSFLTSVFFYSARLHGEFTTRKDHIEQYFVEYGIPFKVFSDETEIQNEIDAGDYIYLIYYGSGIYKYGYTENLRERFNNIKSNSPRFYMFCIKSDRVGDRVANIQNRIEAISTENKMENVLDFILKDKIYRFYTDKTRKFICNTQVVENIISIISTELGYL